MQPYLRLFSKYRLIKYGQINTEKRKFRAALKFFFILRSFTEIKISQVKHSKCDFLKSIQINVSLEKARKNARLLRNKKKTLKIFTNTHRNNLNK